MSFLPNIFNRNPQQGQQGQQGQQPQHPNQQQQQPQQQYQPQQNANGSGGPAGSQQSPQNQNYQQENPSNPLDPFMQLMTPSKEVQQEYQQRQQQESQGLFGDQFTPENVNSQVGKTNFAQNLDPAKIQAALSGDSNAFMEVINQAVAAGVSTSIQASKGMVEHGVKTGTERFSTGLDSRFRDYELRQQNPKNAAMQHPVGKALLSTVAKQIATANPRMSASEVTQQSEQMFEQFASLLKPQQTQDANQQSSSTSAPDWEQFLQ